MDQRSKFKPWSMRLQEKCIGGKFQVIGIEDDFLDITPKSLGNKTKARQMQLNET